MSDETVVETEGVEVTKSFDAEGFPVPAVTFRVESDRSDAVGLRITDEIPEGFGIEQIGFHPDYGSEHWTATGEGVVRFERTVDPGEAFTTVYGIRMADDDEPTPFLEAPTIEVDPDAIEEEDIDDVVPSESSEVVRELASGERDTIPGLEEEEAEEPAPSGTEAAPQTGAEALADDDAEILGEQEAAAAEAKAEEADEPEIKAEAGAEAGSEAEAADEPMEAEAADEPIEAEAASAAEGASEEEDAAESEAQAETADVEAETAGGGAAGVEDLDTESIAAALAAEIRDGNVDDKDLSVIRDAVTESAPSDRVRIDHLQARVSDLEAYTDALESFIDENGEAQELLEDLESEIGDIQDELSSLDSRLDEAATEREDLEADIDQVAEDLDAVEDVEEQIDRLRSDMDALDERVDDAESVRFELESIEDEIEDLQEQVTEVKEWRDQLSNVFGG